MDKIYVGKQITLKYMRSHWKGVRKCLTRADDSFVLTSGGEVQGYLFNWATAVRLELSAQTNWPSGDAGKRLPLPFALWVTYTTAHRKIALWLPQRDFMEQEDEIVRRLEAIQK